MTVGRLRAYRAQLRFCLRATASGVLTLAIAHLFAFPLHGLWAVLTAVVVTQTSLGASLQATIEYVVGTLVGATYAALIGILIPHTEAASQALALGVTIAPLAFIAALSSSFRVAPFSAVLVLLIGAEMGANPLQSAMTRVAEVALGGAIAILVSTLLLPERARRLSLEAAAGILNRMAELLPRILAGCAQTLDAAEIARLQHDLTVSVTAFQALVADGRDERAISLARDSDPGPLGRTLLRLRQDFVITGRAAMEPFPATIADRLAPKLDRLGAEASAFLTACAAALVQGRAPPPIDKIEAAIGAYEAEVQSIRSDGLARALSTAEIERFFTLGFACDQLGRNLHDLARSVQEFTRASGRRMGLAFGR